MRESLWFWAEWSYTALWEKAFSQTVYDKDRAELCPGFTQPEKSALSRTTQEVLICSVSDKDTQKGLFWSIEKAGWMPVTLQALVTDPHARGYGIMTDRRALCEASIKLKEGEEFVL